MKKITPFTPIFFVCGFLLTVLCIQTWSVTAQGHANNWYFGNQAAITFSTVPPSAIAGCAMIQREGNATISDAGGNLLFYTDGVTVWDRNHNVMANGTGLAGQIISAQSAIIAPLPLSTTQYYVFTVPDWENVSASAGLHYSIVDMSLSGGLGAVTAKNILVNSNVREQVTAVHHCNRRDIWIITHEKGNQRYLAYPLTSGGLNMTPVVSTGIMNYVGTNRYGYLKSSTDGQRLCSSLGGVQGLTVELTRFDKSTGTVSDVIAFWGGNEFAYSSEFSPDNTKLYHTGVDNSPVYQFDITSGVAATIAASRVAVSNSNGTKGCLQTGPDGKIYVSRDFAGYIGVINSPNQTGMACNYVDNAIALSPGGTARLGLPNFIQSFFPPTLRLGNDTTLCQGGTLQLNAEFDHATYQWQDGATGPTYTVSETGTYWVKVFLPCDTLTDTIHVTVMPPTGSGLSGQLTLCGGDTLYLSATVSDLTYVWSTGATGNQISIHTEGIYWVRTTNACGLTSTDTIHVTTPSGQPYTIIPEMLLCGTQSGTLDAGPGYQQYLWSTGAVTQTVAVSDTGYLTVSVFDGCIWMTDSTHITRKPVLFEAATQKIMLCDMAPPTFSGHPQADTWLWNTGQTAMLFTAGSAGTYTVQSTNACGSVRDTFIVLPFSGYPQQPDPQEIYCKTDGIKLTAFEGQNYLWSTGQTYNPLTVYAPGSYSVTFHICDSVCTQTFEVSAPGIEPLFFPNVFTPNGDMINETFRLVGQFGQVEQFELSIYNRWGNLLYSTSDILFEWDGRFENQPVSNGVYYYVGRYTHACTGKAWKEIKGHISVLR